MKVFLTLATLMCFARFSKAQAPVCITGAQFPPPSRTVPAFARLPVLSAIGFSEIDQTAERKSNVAMGESWELAADQLR